MHKVKVYTDRIMKAENEEAKSVSTKRFTKPVRIFAWKNKRNLSFSSLIWQTEELSRKCSKFLFPVDKQSKQ